MKNSLASHLIKKFTRAFLLAFAISQINDTASAALYAPGDIVTNLTFYARRSFTRPDGTFVSAGSQVKIKDFAGRVVFLEWFAVWCPFCTAAVPQVDTGIVDWFASGKTRRVPDSRTDRARGRRRDFRRAPRTNPQYRCPPAALLRCRTDTTPRTIRGTRRVRRSP